MGLLTRLKNFFTFEKLSYKLASPHMKRYFKFYDFSDDFSLKHLFFYFLTLFSFSGFLFFSLFLLPIPMFGVIFITILSSLIFAIGTLSCIGVESNPYTTYFWHWIAMKFSKKYTTFSKIDYDFKKHVVNKQELIDFVKKLNSREEEIFVHELAKHDFKSFNKYQLLKISLKEDFSKPLSDFKDEIDSALQYELKNYHKKSKKEIKLEKARKILTCLQHEEEKIVFSDKNKYEIKELSIEKKEREYA